MCVSAVFFVAYQQLENNLIAPRILRHTVSLSAAAVLLAALIGGTVLGLVDALIAIPVAAALKGVLAEQLHVRDTVGAESGVDSYRSRSTWRQFLHTQAATMLA